MNTTKAWCGDSSVAGQVVSIVFVISSASNAILLRRFSNNVLTNTIERDEHVAAIVL